jgi:flotillin
MTTNLTPGVILQLPFEEGLGLPLVLLASVGAGVLVLFSLLVLFISRYKRCPANRVLVISGRVGGGKSAKTLSGGGAFVWPVIQQYDYLSLLPITVEVNLTDALSFENIRVRVPSVFTVAIGHTEEMQQNAAMRLLGLTEPEIKSQAADIIFGQMRQVIASMEIEKINRDRESFLKHIQEALEPELKKLGLVLLNVNIKDLTDDSGYIEAIGKKAAAEAVQKARGDVAEQELAGEKRVAQATQERAIAVANAEREREIGVKSAERDQAVKVAELDKETAIARQRAEFERDTQIASADQERRVAVAGANAQATQGEAQAEQARRVAVAAANAQAVEGETQSQAKIAQAKAELQVREAEAYEQGETRRRVAEASVSEAENRAQAKAALADAERIEAERRAELEAPAKAEKARRIVEAEALAESRKLEAQAEADALLARLRAEAQGEYEKLAKKAEGLGRIVAECGSAEDAYRLLLLEHMDHLADKAAEAIGSIKMDKVMLWGGGNGGKGSNGGVADFVRDLGSSVVPMMHLMRDIGGVQLPDSVLRFAENGEAPAAPAGKVKVGAIAEVADGGAAAPEAPKA